MSIPEIPVNLVRIRQRDHKYTLDEKKNILLDQAMNKLSNRAVASKYNLDEKSIRKYKKSIDISLDYSKEKYTLHMGKTSSGTHLEPSLCQWIDELRTDSCDVTVELAVFELLKLDHGINKPFKDKFRTAWTQWMVNENRQNNLTVTRPLLARWVSSVWNSIDTTTVENTWAKCGYYNTT